MSHPFISFNEILIYRFMDYIVHLVIHNQVSHENYMYVFVRACLCLILATIHVFSSL